MKDNKEAKFDCQAINLMDKILEKLIFCGSNECILFHETHK